MTKARTVGQKNRDRRGRPKDEDVQREPNGRASRKAARESRDAVVMEQIQARCRALGIWPEPIQRLPGEPAEIWKARQDARVQMIRAATRYVGLPWMGSNAGRAIAGETDVAKLWSVVVTIGKRHAAYLRAIDARQEQGVLARLVPPDRNEAGDAVESVEADLRTEEERYGAAIAAWERLQSSGLQGVLDAIVNDVALPQPVARERAVPETIVAWMKAADPVALTALRDTLFVVWAEKTRVPQVTVPIAAALRRIAFADEFGRAPKDAAELRDWWGS